MVYLTMVRFGVREQFEHDTVIDAARSACLDVDSNEAAPVSIEENGTVIWVNNGPFDDSYEKLRELAKMGAA